MIRKSFVLLLVFFQLCCPAFASVLTVDEVSVIGAAADDYYTGSRPKLKVINGSNVGKTLVSSAQLSSTAALSGLTAGAAGIAGISYYQRTGKDPVYAVASALASAADALFVPAYQAFRANFVSPESYPASAAQYVGVEASVGASIGNICNFVLSQSSSAFSDLKNLISSHIITTPSNPNLFTTGTVFFYNGTNRKILSLAGFGGSVMKANMPYYPSTWVPGQEGVVSYYAQYDWFLVYTPTTDPTVYRFAAWKYTNTTDPVTVTPVESVDYPGLKTALDPVPAAVADQISDAIMSLPADQKITSSDPAPSQVPAANPQTITNNQIKNFFTENTTNVYNEYLNTVANESSTVTNEAARAAAELSKSQSDEVADETSQDDYSADSPSLDVPEIKDVDFTPITDLAGEMLNVFPFGLIGSVQTALEPLSSTPVPPSFDIDLGFWRQTVSCDTPSLNNLASMVRGVASFLFYCLTGFYCVKLYQRM